MFHILREMGAELKVFNMQLGGSSLRMHNHKEDLECFLQGKGVTFPPQNNKTNAQEESVPQRKKCPLFLFLRGKVALEQISFA